MGTLCREKNGTWVSQPCRLAVTGAAFFRRGPESKQGAKINFEPLRTQGCSNKLDFYCVIGNSNMREVAGAPHTKSKRCYRKRLLLLYLHFFSRFGRSSVCTVMPHQLHQIQCTFCTPPRLWRQITKAYLADASRVSLKRTGEEWQLQWSPQALLLPELPELRVSPATFQGHEASPRLLALR